MKSLLLSERRKSIQSLLNGRQNIYYIKEKLCVNAVWIRFKLSNGMSFADLGRGGGSSSVLQHRVNEGDGGVSRGGVQSGHCGRCDWATG